MVEFSAPYLLLLMPLALVPLLLDLLFERRRTATLAYPWLGFAGKIPKTARVRLRHLPKILRTLALVLLVVALAGPRTRAEDQPIFKEGIDIVVVLDMSPSMLALDFKPSDRFTVARETVARFADGRESDRLGLVVFAGESFSQCPLTLDRSIFKNVLKQISVDAVLQGLIEDGTAIGDALSTGLLRLRNSEAKSKVMILLTDGDDNRSTTSPVDAAKLAQELGVKIYSVQVGRGGLVDYPARDMFGRQTVVQRNFPVNPKLLKELAQLSNGEYFVATDAYSLQGIFDRINELETTELPDQQFVLYDEIYSAFALPALLLILLEVALGGLWLRRFP